MRAFLGCIAGAIAVLTFHQGSAELFHILGLARHTAFRLVPTWPFGVPSVVSLTLWGALYGAAFGLIAPHLRRPVWLQGVGLGLIAASVALFVVAPLKGHAVAYGFEALPVTRTLIVTATWGLGVGLILPLLRPRLLPRHTVARLPAHQAFSRGGA